jgi:hypothetical protein
LDFILQAEPKLRPATIFLDNFQKLQPQPFGFIILALVLFPFSAEGEESFQLSQGNCWGWDW